MGSTKADKKNVHIRLLSSDGYLENRCHPSIQVLAICGEVTLGETLQKAADINVPPPAGAKRLERVLTVAQSGNRGNMMACR